MFTYIREVLTLDIAFPEVEFAIAPEVASVTVFALPESKFCLE